MPIVLSPATLKKRRDKAHNILVRLKKLLPHAGMILKYGNNWELLVAVILSAQCTDKKVNEVTKILFKRYKTISSYAQANTKEFEHYIYSTGFYRAKTRNIIAAANMIQKNFHGRIPRTMTEMLRIPGVARKTANVVLGNAYGVVEGIAVDTHVKRLAYKLGLTNHTDPNKIEHDLMEIIPKKDWFRATYLFIEYGRKFCSAKKHNHSKCPLRRFDRSYFPPPARVPPGEKRALPPHRGELKRGV